MKTVTFDTLTHHHDFFRSFRGLWQRLKSFSVKPKPEPMHIDFFADTHEMEDYLISFRF